MRINRLLDETFVTPARDKAREQRPELELIAAPREHAIENVGANLAELMRGASLRAHARAMYCW